MNKIIILSDTHQNKDLLQRVLEQNQDSKYLIHLGDEPDDLEYFPELISEMYIYSVFGIYHQAWRQENSVLDFFIQINDNYALNFHIAHVKEHHTIVDSKEKGINLYCFGHTHHRYFEQVYDSTYFLNPGHLKKFFDRGEKAGYAIIEHNEVLNQIELFFKDYQSNIIERYIL
ncbi:MAG: metallophosphatase family protein [Candidatus Cloacimonetes bacterium]|nr:metallophosphatase family protein [Candidatus Cloacimonadota bacterium]